MTPLRQRMMEDLRLRGYSERTVESYIGSVAQLARHYDIPPDQLSEEQLRAYVLHLSTGRKLARASVTVALSGIKFFYERTLGRHWPVLAFIRPSPEKKLPVVLDREEVWRVLDAVRNPGYRVCFTAMYACGLRLLEGARLQVRPHEACRQPRRTSSGPTPRGTAPPVSAGSCGTSRAISPPERPHGDTPIDTPTHHPDASQSTNGEQPRHRPAELRPARAKHAVSAQSHARGALHSCCPTASRTSSRRR